MRVADQLGKFLHDNGVRHAFIFIGGANSVICDGLAKVLTLIPMAHEQAAAMAATYYYRTCGRIAPCVVTAGAGCVNTFTGVMAAHVDGIPLMVISGNEKSNFLVSPGPRVAGFQGFDPTDVVKPFVKEVRSVGGADDAKLSMADIYNAALAHRQGAAWLDIPQDIAAMEAA